MYSVPANCCFTGDGAGAVNVFLFGARLSILISTPESRHVDGTLWKCKTQGQAVYTCVFSTHANITIFAMRLKRKIVT